MVEAAVDKSDKTQKITWTESLRMEAFSIPLEPQKLTGDLLDAALCQGRLPRYFKAPENLFEMRELLGALRGNSWHVEEAAKLAGCNAEVAQHDAQGVMGHRKNKRYTTRWEQKLKAKYLKAIGQDLGEPVFELRPLGLAAHLGPVPIERFSLSYPFPFQVAGPNPSEFCYDIVLNPREDSGMSSSRIRRGPFSPIAVEDQKTVQAPITGWPSRFQKPQVRFLTRTHQNHLKALVKAQGLFIKGETPRFLNRAEMSEAIRIRDSVITSFPAPDMDDSPLNTFLYWSYRKLTLDGQLKRAAEPDRHYREFVAYLEAVLENESERGKIELKQIRPLTFRRGKDYNYVLTINGDPIVQAQDDGYCLAIVASSKDGADARFALTRYQAKRTYYHELGEKFGMLEPGTLSTELGVRIFSKAPEVSMLFDNVISGKGLFGAGEALAPEPDLKPLHYGQSFLTDQVEKTEEQWTDYCKRHHLTLAEAGPRIHQNIFLEGAAGSYKAYCFGEYTILEPDEYANASYVVRENILGGEIRMSRQELRKHPGFVSRFSHGKNNEDERNSWEQRLRLFTGNPDFMTERQRYLAEQVRMKTVIEDSLLPQSLVGGRSMAEAVQPISFKGKGVGMAFNHGDFFVVELNSDGRRTLVIPADNFEKVCRLSYSKAAQADGVKTVAHDPGINDMPLNRTAWSRRISAVVAGVEVEMDEGPEMETAGEEAELVPA